MKSKQYIQVFDKQVDAKGDETSIYGKSNFLTGQTSVRL